MNYVYFKIVIFRFYFGQIYKKPGNVGLTLSDGTAHVCWQKRKNPVVLFYMYLQYVSHNLQHYINPNPPEPLPLLLPANLFAIPFSTV